jgi:Ubiquitin carboxyl-terminal hydrolase
MHCNHCSYKLEPFLDISLSLDITAPPFSTDDCSGHLAGTNRQEIQKEAEVCNEIEEDTNELIDPVNDDLGQSSSAASSSQPRGTAQSGVKDDSITLYQCLEHFTSQETLSEQVHCDKCKQHRPSKKRLSLSAAPKVLILHFKRFDSLRQLKICSKVNFPLRDLDLTPFMQQQHHVPESPHDISSSHNSTHSTPLFGISNTAQNPKSSPLLYDLQGLVSHRGSLTQVPYLTCVPLDVTQHDLTFCLYSLQCLLYLGTLCVICRHHEGWCHV